LVTADPSYFLQELIDYAGLFPPASLDLPAALRDYQSCRRSPDAWMLGRFICPASLLQKAGRDWQELEPTTPLRLSVLGGSIVAPEFGSRLDQMAKTVRAGGQIEIIELHLPSAPDSASSLDRILAHMTSEIAARDLDNLDVFLESSGDSGRQLIPRLKHTERAGRLGFKLRCGGVEASAFPSVETVAWVLMSCVEHQVPFKATAGLHHPIRYFDSHLGVTSHGFLNVFVAGLLAAISDADWALVEGCLMEEKPAHFGTSEGSVSWSGHEIAAEKVRDLRSQLMTSFGSCSFREPVEDLRALGWLNEIAGSLSRGSR